MLRTFRQVDVFTTTPYRATRWPWSSTETASAAEEMQRFAHWTNLSETTFILPPTSRGADYRVRIFTASIELPFAGHPTLGTCHAWLAAGGAHGSDGVIQECGGGLVAGAAHGDGLAFAAPPLMRSGPVDEPLVEHIADGLGIGRATIVDAEWADNGPGWVAVLLDERRGGARAAARASTDLDLGVAGLYPPGSPQAIEVRAFLPGDGGHGRGPGDRQPERLASPSGCCAPAGYRAVCGRPGHRARPAGGCTSPPAGAPRAVRGRWSGWAAPASRVSSARLSCEPYAVTRPELCGDRQVRRPHHADHRVATGRRMVGEEDDRLPARRHLDRPRHHALAGQLALACPRRAGGRAGRTPTRLLSWLTSYGSAQSSAERLRREPVVARAPARSAARRAAAPRRVPDPPRSPPAPPSRPPGARSPGAAAPGRARTANASERWRAPARAAIPPRTARYVRNPHTGAPNRSSPPAGTQN